MLGGIEVPHSRGLAGHSDADVALHAITDALLGAGGLGDIGEHFRPPDPKWKGVSSEIFLAHAASCCARREQSSMAWIVRSSPRSRRSALIVRQCVNGSRRFRGLSLDQVSIKATTTEGLGFTGRREGIAAQAIASIRLGAEW